MILHQQETNSRMCSFMGRALRSCTFMCEWLQFVHEGGLFSEASWTHADLYVHLQARREASTSLRFHRAFGDKTAAVYVFVLGLLFFSFSFLYKIMNKRGKVLNGNNLLLLILLTEIQYSSAEAQNLDYTYGFIVTTLKFTIQVLV